ncbi:SufE family protein [Candidatus Williamhamiltonella defendens]|uniref:SufE family protein n=1 Tax=Candidatus Williamhamiltonella defendens TaxID=138072 RepID=UPI002A4E2290|nr:SufE family protein [Candidatus Hamiltonella defensa]
MKQPYLEMSGYQNKVWLRFQKLFNGLFHFYGDSEGWIVRGLLGILFTLMEGKTSQQLAEQNLLDFLIN